MSLRELLIETIQTKRPNLSVNSIKTYVSVLSALANKLQFESIADFNKNTKDIIQSVQDHGKPQTKKTLLSACFVLTENQAFKDELEKWRVVVRDNYAEQKTDPNRLANMPTMEEVESKYDEYKARAFAKGASTDDWVCLMIVAVTCGKFLHVRRNRDWCEMKMKGGNAKTDNVITKTHFVFNRFKTAKFVTDDDKRIAIEPELNALIAKWKRLNRTDWFVFNANTGKPYDSSAFTKKVQSIYGDGIGVDALRSLKATDMLKGIDFNEVRKVATQMGTSTTALMSYYSKNDLPA